MSDIQANILFPESGMDTDSSDFYMKNGDSPFRLHLMHGTDGTQGVVENMKGNHLATYSLTLSNCYQVLGSYYDRLTRKCYYWVFSQPYDFTSSGDYIYDNRLLCFDENTEDISLIFLDEKNYFGLGLNYPVKDCDMLGDYLYFNPRISEPKMIDVVRAKNYTDYLTLSYDPLSAYVVGDKRSYLGGVFLALSAVAIGETPCTHPLKWERIGDCYHDFNDIGFDSELRYAFNTIRQIPVYRPICNYGTDADKNSNNVRGKVFRFSHRYRYFDNTYSKWSAYSDVTLPEYSEYYNGEVPDDLDLYNYIAVDIHLHSASLVKEVDIAFQEIGQDWRKAKTVNRWEQGLLDDAHYTYKFYNSNSSYTVIDPEEFEEPYDSVPRTAATQELINKNILAYGRCKMGFANLNKDEIDVTLTPELEAIPTGISEQLVRRNCITEGDWTINYFSTSPPTIAYMTLNTDGMNAVKQSGDIFLIQINGKDQRHTFTAGEVASQAAFTEAIRLFIDTEYSNLVVTSNALDEIYVWRNTEDELGINKSLLYEPTGAAEAALTKKGGFKTGAWHPFCLFYYDEAMRRCDAQTSKENNNGSGYAIDGTTVYVPMLNEISPPPTDTGNRWIMNWSVNHLPPDYAKWWRWGYAGNALCSSFVQYVIEEVDPTTEPTWVKINIRPLQTLKTTDESVPNPWNQFPQSIIDPWEFIKGDRVRIITEDLDSANMGLVYDGVLDFEIVKYDDTVAKKYWIYTQDFDTTGLGAGTLIEIYRPQSEDTPTIFYEFGELMPIIEDADGERVHGCGVTGVRDQSTALSLSCQGVFEMGDVYHILRTPSYPIDATEGYFHESMWYSDFYTSDDWSKGRPGVETSFGERTLNIIQYSNQYLQNTQINGLSTFEADNYKEINDIYGNIVGMIEVGNTLKVYMQKKVASVQIGRQEWMDADGNVTTSSSDVVLGSVRYSDTNFGTQWIESLTKNNRYVYFFDVFNGVMCRDSANGVFPISGRFEGVEGVGDFKMETWFRDKAEALVKSGIDHVTVMTVWDERYKCLYVVFRDVVNGENDATIVFHEPTNRWITLADFTQTPTDGYNVMLELDYWVLQGFQLGIGFEFDEDSRFAIFNIGNGQGTTSDVTMFDDLLELEFEVLEPDILVTPATPTALAATAQTSTGFTANWSAVPGATGYKLLWSEVVGAYNTLDVGNVTTYALDVTLYGYTEHDYDSPYYYVVVSYNTAGDSAWSNMITTATIPTVPIAPGMLPASNPLATSFVARWNASVSASVVGYYLDVATDNAFASILTGYNNLSVSALLQLVSGLSQNTAYYYRVRAYDHLGQTSANSATISATTASVPNAPVALDAGNKSSTGFTLKWEPSSGAIYYNVDVSTDIAFGTYITGWQSKPTANGAVNIDITGLTASTTYYYRVRAVGSGGSSSNSNVITVATTATIPSKPISLAATEEAYDSFKANWGAVTGATGYYLDVATDDMFMSYISGYQNRNVLNVTSFTVSGLPYGITTFYYRVRAYNLTGTSVSSDTITAETLIS